MVATQVESGITGALSAEDIGVSQFINMGHSIFSRVKVEEDP